MVHRQSRELICNVVEGLRMADENEGGRHVVV
jgi:hypothetical protein